MNYEHFLDIYSNISKNIFLNIIENEMSYDVFMKVDLHTPVERMNNSSFSNEKKIYELA